MSQIAEFNSATALSANSTLQKIPDTLLRQCLSSQYFDPCNFQAKADLFQNTVDNTRFVNISESVASNINISSFLKTADEETFFLSHHVYEAVHHGDEFLPNRSKLTVSYPWKSIFNLPLLRGSSPSGKNIEQVIDDIFAYLGFSENDFSPNVRFDISLAGSEKNPLSSIFFSMHLSQAKECLMNLISAPYKINGLELPFMCIQFRGFKKNLRPKDSYYEYSNKKPRNFILFIDSLDLNFLEIDKKDVEFSSLSYLYNNSLLFKNFTASADWTYPCLHSMHTGISPHLSFSFRRLSSYTNYCDLKRMLKTVNKYHNPGLFFMRFKDKNPWLKYLSLSALLDRYGFSQVALNSSTNHCRASNFTSGIPLSIEGISPFEVTDYLKKVLRAYDQFNVNTIYLDLDHFHMTSPSGISNLISGVSPAPSFFQRPTKEQRLSGDYSFIEQEKDVYYQRAKMVDVAVKEILEAMSDGDKLLLFSDHGSIWSSNSHFSEYSRLIPQDSSLNINKILGPCLLIYERGNEVQQVVEDIVMTHDLYSIVAYMHGIIIDSYLSSRLPKCLGGSYGRKSSYSFGTVRDTNCNYYDCLIRENSGNLSYHRSVSQESVKLDSQVTSHSFMTELFEGLEINA